MKIRSTNFIYGVLLIGSLLELPAHARPSKYVIDPALLAQIEEQDKIISELPAKFEAAKDLRRHAAETALSEVQRAAFQIQSLKWQQAFLRKIADVDANSNIFFDFTRKRNLLKRMQLIDQKLLELHYKWRARVKDHKLEDLYSDIMKDPRATMAVYRPLLADTTFGNFFYEYHYLMAQKLALGRVLHHLFPSSEAIPASKGPVEEIIRTADSALGAKIHKFRTFGIQNKKYFEEQIAAHQLIIDPLNSNDLTDLLHLNKHLSIHHGKILDLEPHLKRGDRSVEENATRESRPRKLEKYFRDSKGKIVVKLPGFTRGMQLRRALAAH